MQYVDRSEFSSAAPSCGTPLSRAPGLSGGVYQQIIEPRGEKLPAILTDIAADAYLRRPCVRNLLEMKFLLGRRRQRSFNKLPALVA
jgi:hypothetical protein